MFGEGVCLPYVSRGCVLAEPSGGCVTMPMGLCACVFREAVPFQLALLLGIAYSLRSNPQTMYPRNSASPPPFPSSPQYLLQVLPKRIVTPVS